MDHPDFRRWLDGLGDAVLACDRDGRVRHANPAAGRLLGRPAGDLAGRPIEAIGSDRWQAENPGGLDLEAGSGPLNLTAGRHDGSELELELDLSPFPARDGAPAMLATLRPRPGGAADPGPIRYLRATTAVATRIGGRPALDDILSTAARALVDDFGASLGRIWLVRGGGSADRGDGVRFAPLVLRATAVRPASGGLPPGVDDRPAPLLPGRDEAPEAEAVRLGRPLVQPLGEGAAKVVAPLVAAGGTLGVLAGHVPAPVPEGLVDALGAFGAVVAAAINDSRLLLREQAARRESEAQARRLRTILDVIPVGVLLAEGPEGRLTLANPAARAILGVDVEAMTLDRFLDDFPLAALDGRILDRDDRPLPGALRDGKDVRLTARMRRPDGREVVLDLNASPFPGPAGGAVSAFVDVTERFRLEAELADRAAQFKALLDHLPVGVAYFDRMGVCRASNGPARRTLGRSRREITGATGTELFAHNPELRDGLLRCIDDHQAFAAAKVPWPADGEDRFLDWRFEPLAAAEPARSRGALALMIDVTERTRAEFALARAADDAQDASRRKTQFLSAVSHDLRTPVNALSLQAELIARLIELKGEEDEELTQLTLDIRQVAANLIELINDLLDLTRFDSGMMDFRVSEFSLDEFLEKNLAPLEAAAVQKGLDFTWRVDRPGRLVRGDKVKLARVLTNLVSNAVKFTERGSVDVVARPGPDGGLALTVRDSGLGIPDDQLGRIFDEFAQLRNPERDRTKGTGLGLAICRRLVDGVGGRLTVESRVGHGSTFVAAYPATQMVLLACDPEPEPAASTSGAEAVPAVDDPILVVEDDPNSRETLVRLLRRTGYPVQAAPDGPTALALLEHVRPSVILLDLMMPGMEGGEVLRTIRAHPLWNRHKVVLLTGDVLTGRTADLMALNVDGILAKPVDFKQLLQTVAHLAPAPGRETVDGPLPEPPSEA